MQKNLEQIRAKHALAFWRDREKDDNVKGEQGGDVVRGLASLIINNGLLATIAFSKEKGKGYETFMVEIGKFLCDGDVAVIRGKVASLDAFICALTENDSHTLQRATDETLAYIAYLKRFRVK